MSAGCPDRDASQPRERGRARHRTLAPVALTRIGSGALSGRATPSDRPYGSVVRAQSRSGNPVSEPLSITVGTPGRSVATRIGDFGVVRWGLAAYSRAPWSVHRRAAL